MYWLVRVTMHLIFRSEIGVLINSSNKNQLIDCTNRQKVFILRQSPFFNAYALPGIRGRKPIAFFTTQLHSITQIRHVNFTTYKLFFL